MVEFFRPECQYSINVDLMLKSRGNGDTGIFWEVTVATVIFPAGPIRGHGRLHAVRDQPRVAEGDGAADDQPQPGAWVPWCGGVVYRRRRLLNGASDNARRHHLILFCSLLSTNWKKFGFLDCSIHMETWTWRVVKPKINVRFLQLEAY